ncbi:MAG TPA: alpha-2-macroglobulin family protein, partial [Elusimicrobiales bacterium]|nr:alpha-2-macroglobulin family protein [Elusimicrobiales bacterium]
KGGFSVRWFGASDFKIYSGQTHIDVPRPEKELAVSLDAPTSMEPGAQAQWLLSVKDQNGKPAAGEALVKVYDRSLEYYAKDERSWLDSLYPPNGEPGAMNLPVYNSHTISQPVKEGLIKKLWEAMRAPIAEPQPPYLLLTSSYYHGRNRYKSVGAAAEGEFLMKADGMRRSIAPIMAERLGAGGPDAADLAAPTATPQAMSNAAGGGGAGGQAQPQARADFSETAYFQPQLPIKNGTAKISFKMPERLSSWQVSLSALTPDVKRGKASAQVQTRKDFMARLEMPRFFREGDKGMIKALIHNETDGPLNASVALQLEQDGQTALPLFDVSRPQTQIEIKPGEIKAVEWTVSAPRGVAVYKARILARSGRYADAEEKDLPILPSRQRLVASQLKSIQIQAANGSVTTELALNELLDPDKSRVVESLHLQVDPQLALSILNSLPFLVHYPYECTEQLVNRYVPLAIVNQIYGKYPALAEATKKIPSRNTITPAWERDNPARMTALLETPWDEISRGRKSFWPVTDMLKPATVAQERQAALAKLESYQLGNGAFPWFPGGREDLYMTLYALEGFAQAQSYGVAIPEDTVRRAMSYVNSELPQHIKPEEGPLSLALYAAYVMTSFPRNWSESASGYANARRWLEYAEKYSNAMTAYGKAHAALAWHKLGDKQRSAAYLDRALDGAKTDPIAGVYWTPEKISWLWYNDTVEKHAFLLRALAVLRPQDLKIGGLAQWLLFNRKGNEWKSTRASAAAIYSLLEVLKSRGALDKGDSYSIQWG